MAYQEYMKSLIKKVEASRQRRLENFQAGKHHARIPVDKVEEFLLKYHPDYMEGNKRPLAVGANKGEIVPNEVADILEARCLVDPGQINLEQVDHRTDVLIIGGGRAASAATLIAQEQGLAVLMATKLRIGDANTMMAEGGIQTADKLHGGGTSRRRMHSAGDMTGAAIMRVLRDEVRNRPQGIRVMEFSPVVELLLDDKGSCAGGIILNMETGQYQLVRAKATIIATGGFGRLHIQGFPTTNPHGPGRGLARLAHAGDHPRTGIRKGQLPGQVPAV